MPYEFGFCIRYTCINIEIRWLLKLSSEAGYYSFYNHDLVSYLWGKSPIKLAVFWNVFSHFESISGDAISLFIRLLFCKTANSFYQLLARLFPMKNFLPFKSFIINILSELESKVRSESIKVEIRYWRSPNIKRPMQKHLVVDLDNDTFLIQYHSSPCWTSP